jgi:hypothetical protein
VRFGWRSEVVSGHFQGGAAGSVGAPVHPLVLPFRVLSLLAAQMFDFATFTIMVGHHGIAAEMNPLVAAGFAAFGMPMLVLMKGALTLLLASIVVILDRGQPSPRGRVAWAAVVCCLGVAAGLLGGLSNINAT